MAMQVMTVEYLPAIRQEKLEVANCRKYSLANLSALGVAFEPLVAAFQSVVGQGAGGSGIYRINTKGLRMAEFNNGSGFLGSLLTDSGAVGGGQAIITQLSFDPTMLFMAAALINVEKKLDDIQELQQDIMDFLKAKEKAKLLGDINVLTDILNNYKFNWNNEKYKTNKHILVQDIRKDSEQSLIFCRDQIERQLAKKGFIHSDEEVEEKLQKVQAEFNDYQLALYLYSFSAFLAVMLLENFDSQYLESVSLRIGEYSFSYRELFTSCYNQIEGLSKSSVQSFLTKGLASISKGAGEAIAKIPVVSKGPVDEAFIAASAKLGQFNLRKTGKAMDRLVCGANNCAAPFIENIKTVNQIYNQPVEILFDEHNLYFLAG